VTQARRGIADHQRPVAVARRTEGGSLEERASQEPIGVDHETGFAAAIDEDDPLLPGGLEIPEECIVGGRLEVWQRVCPLR
jgi:hypothetical protein